MNLIVMAIAIGLMVASVATALTLASPSASALADNNESGRKAAWKILNKNTSERREGGKA